MRNSVEWQRNNSTVQPHASLTLPQGTTRNSHSAPTHAAVCREYISSVALAPASFVDHVGGRSFVPPWLGIIAGLPPFALWISYDNISTQHFLKQMLGFRNSPTIEIQTLPPNPVLAVSASSPRHDLSLPSEKSWALSSAFHRQYPLQLRQIRLGGFSRRHRLLLLLLRLPPPPPPPQSLNSSSRTTNWAFPSTVYTRSSTKPARNSPRPAETTTA